MVHLMLPAIHSSNGSDVLIFDNELWELIQLWWDNTQGAIWCYFTFLATFDRKKLVSGFHSKSNTKRQNLGKNAYIISKCWDASIKLSMLTFTALWWQVALFHSWQLAVNTADAFFYPPSSGIFSCVGNARTVLWRLHLRWPCCIALLRVLIWVLYKHRTCS